MLSFVYLNTYYWDNDVETPGIFTNFLNLVKMAFSTNKILHFLISIFILKPFESKTKLLPQKVALYYIGNRCFTLKPINKPKN